MVWWSNMKIVRIIVLLTSLFAVNVSADSWRFKKEIKHDWFEVAALKIERIRDTLSDQRWPTYQMKIYRNGKELASYRNLTFDEIIPFDENNFLLGISNSGLSKFAYFVLDSDGGLIRAINHSLEIPYCDTSISILRTWVQLDQLIINEHYETYKGQSENSESIKYLKSATLKTCGGEIINILEAK